jgi:hypothetical protein
VRGAVAVAVAVELFGCGRRPSPPPPPPPAAPGAVSFGGLDAYGSAAFDAPVLARFGPDARRLVETDPPGGRDLLGDKVQALGDFIWTDVAVVTYFEAGGQVAYVTIDVVERKDAARRMPFRAAPTGTVADPEDLSATWQSYEAKLFTLLSAGAVSAEYKPCPAWHCHGDYDHPELRPLVEKLITRVPVHVDDLAHVLRADRDPVKRAGAAFALAHAPDGARLVALMLEAMTDDSALVRNAAMRVLADIAHRHPDLAMPIEPFLGAIDWPSTTDRNKALAIIAGLLARPDGARHRDLVARRAGPTLVALLRLRQPNNHDFAWVILKAVSGREYDDRDEAAWTAWLGTLAATPSGPAPAE